MRRLTLNTLSIVGGLSLDEIFEGLLLAGGYCLLACISQDIFESSNSFHTSDLFGLERDQVT